MNDVEKSKANTIYIEQTDGSYKGEMINPEAEPRGNVVWVEQDNGTWKPKRISNYA